MKKPHYVPEECGCCGQSTTYALAIDKGTVEIVKQIALFIEKKGINVVHPRKELEGNGLSSNQVGNLTRPRSHGLIAKVKGEAGNYCITEKGLDFLKGKTVPRVAIMSKKDGVQVGYHEPDTNLCTVTDFNSDGEYWEGVNYEIREGRIIKDV
jgi:predicted transcriptional regulator